jgi:Protein of unknown function (DUF3606)
MAGEPYPGTASCMPDIKAMNSKDLLRLQATKTVSADKGIRTGGQAALRINDGSTLSTHRRHGRHAHMSSIITWRTAMTDETIESAPTNRFRIDIDDHDDMIYWTKELGVTEEQLRATVQSVGVMAVDVRAELLTG